MAIDFSLPDDVVEVRNRVRAFIDEEIRPLSRELRGGGPEAWRGALDGLQQKARSRGLWCPHMPPKYGGMGLGPLGIATVSAECGRHPLAATAINCNAPNEGNMHTLLHFGTDEQKEKYLRPLCDAKMRSCFAMTEPEVASSDPTNLRTTATKDGDQWVINGHKWFISGAQGAQLCILIAVTDTDSEARQGRNSAFLVDLPAKGFEIVRDIETMAGRGNHCEIMIKDLRVPDSNMLGPRGHGHMLGQVRLGPARLSHCMRWIGQIELALDMMIKRAEERELHGAPLSDKQGIQWKISEATLALYQCKLMVLHAAYLIENNKPFKNEVSMTKYFVAQTLWKVVDQSLQVHGALGYSTDIGLERMLRAARSARLVDGADEVHLTQIARHALEAFRRDGTVRMAAGHGLLFGLK